LIIFLCINSSIDNIFIFIKRKYNGIKMSSNVNSNKKPKEMATLKVAEAEQRDVGRKIARIDPAIAKRINITSGDALEITSLGRKTTVLNWPAKESDRDKGLIRIDGLIRNRLDVGINDLVEIRVVESKDAKSITFAPIEPLRIMGAEEFLSEYLNGTLMTKGDTIPINVMGRRVDLVVISTSPSGPVIITNSTEIIVSEESSKAEQISKQGENASITYEDIG
jgi:transitional endoplasmic reticulum ATPase